MSKFQVGDKVRVYDRDNPYPGVVESVRDDGKVFVSHVGGVRLWWAPDALVHADPHVPDVDGNPIRAGQLVEACGESTTPFIGARRVKEVADIPGSPPSASLPGTGWWSSRDLRVLTADDLLCPPEPATRDVALRVTVGAMPQILDNGVAETVRELLYQCGSDVGFVDWATVTVEVVDDGGHDDE